VFLLVFVFLPSLGVACVLWIFLCIDDIIIDRYHKLKEFGYYVEGSHFCQLDPHTHRRLQPRQC
jgi:hypothetical protein